MLRKFILYCLFTLCALNFIWAGSDTLLLQSRRNDKEFLQTRKQDSTLNISVFKKNESHPTIKKFRLNKKNDSELLFDSELTQKQFSTFTDSLYLTETDYNNFLFFVKSLPMDSIIVFQLFVPGQDSVSSTSGTSIPNKGNRGIPVKLFYILAFLLGIGATLFFYWIRNKFSKKTGSSRDTAKGATSILKKGFQLSDKETDITKISGMVVNQFLELSKDSSNTIKGLNEQVIQKDNRIARLGTEINEYKTEAENKEEIIKSLNKEVNDLGKNISYNNTALEKQKEIAKSILNKFYTPLVNTLENKSEFDETELKKLTLNHLLLLSLHIISTSRLLTERYTDSDEANALMLIGQDVTPKKVIDTNTPYTSMDRLAYIVLKILNDYGIHKLDDVLVHGYKIG